mgnify:FL=1|jgi:hypothetical protein
MNIKYTFSGHESFPCKSLWLKKGYDFVNHERNFNAPDAVIDLGVGKNMVSSIRFWLKSFGLYDGEHLSELADYLFDEVAGRDKYMEDLATLWLLHFTMQLFRKSRQTLVFNKFKTCLKNSDTRKIQYCSI